jgi:hypothetical protein
MLPTPFTLTTASLPLDNDCVLGRELMVVLAMGLLRVLTRGAYTTASVLTRSDYFEVEWINAAAIPAEMVDLQAVRNRAIEILICNTVSELLSSVFPSLAVTLGTDVSQPWPTSMNIREVDPHPKRKNMAVSRHRQLHAGDRG